MLASVSTLLLHVSFLCAKNYARSQTQVLRQGQEWENISKFKNNSNNSLLLNTIWLYVYVHLHFALITMLWDRDHDSGFTGVEIEAEMLGNSPSGYRVTKWQNKGHPQALFDFQIQSSIGLLSPFPGFTSLHSPYHQKNIFYLFLFVVCIQALECKPVRLGILPILFSAMSFTPRIEPGT